MRAGLAGSSAVHNKRRLAALRNTRLLDTPPDERFDRLTRIAARFTHAPVILVSLVDGERQFFKSQHGLPEPWATLRQMPLSHSFCKHVVESGTPLVVHDVGQNALLKQSLAATEVGIVAYLGVPLRLDNGHVLGALCAVDVQARQWTKEEIDALTEIASLIMEDILAHYKVRHSNTIRHAFKRIKNWFRGVTRAQPPAGGFTWDVANGRIVFDDQTQRLFETHSREICYDDFLNAICQSDRPVVETAMRAASVAGYGLDVDLDCSVIGKNSGKRRRLKIKGQQNSSLHRCITGVMQELEAEPDSDKVAFL